MLTGVQETLSVPVPYVRINFMLSLLGMLDLYVSILLVMFITSAGALNKTNRKKIVSLSSFSVFFLPLKTITLRFDLVDLNAIALLKSKTASLRTIIRS